MGRELERLGHRLDIFESQKAPKSPELQNYDSVIVGSPVYANRYKRRLRKWVKVHSPTLNQMPSAFYSVCLGILQDDETTKREERTIVKKFFQETAWHPDTWTIFAGALNFTQYNWIIKRIMRRISKKTGGDTDLSRDFEYTNWDDVLDFAQRFSERLTTPRMRISSEAVATKY